jgi:predicted metalloprotease
MVTVVNNPPAQNIGNDTGGGGMGMIVGVILVIIVLLLIFMFGWPAMNRGGGGGETPSTGNEGNNGATYNVPDEIDINVQKK